MNPIDATVSPFAPASTLLPQAPSNDPGPSASSDKGQQDCVKRYPVNQFSLRNLQRGYAQ